MDRKFGVLSGFMSLSWSLSARRAWIENSEGTISLTLTTVALRKESVDRKLSNASSINATRVALRKESVDRKLEALYILHKGFCRSPQGERG